MHKLNFLTINIINNLKLNLKMENELELKIAEVKEKQREMMLPIFRRYRVIKSDETLKENQFRIAVQIMIWTHDRSQNLYNHINKLLFNHDATPDFIQACLDCHDQNFRKGTELWKISQEIKRLSQQRNYEQS